MTQKNSENLPFEVLLSAPFTSEVSIKGRNQDLHIYNVTGEAPTNKSYLSIMANSCDGPAKTSDVPLGWSTYSIPNGATLVAAADSDDVKILFGWE